MHMTFRKSYWQALMAFTSLSTSALASASSLPGDLQQLWQAYHAVSKVEPSSSAGQWQLEELNLDPRETLHSDELLHRELTNLAEQGMLIKSLSYTANKAVDQEAVVDALRPNKGEASNVCQGFVYEAYTPRLAVSLTADELAAANLKHQAKHCRRNLNQIFSGIFHAQSPLTMLQAEIEKDGQLSKAVIIYIGSFAKADAYLRYQIIAPRT